MRLQIPRFSTARVVVLGDIMLDRYWTGPVARISPEAPVPVVRVDHVEERPGGAGNVALNVAALGGRITLIGPTGDDEAADILAERLGAAGVDCHLLRMPTARTILKLRVLSRHQQLIRLDFEQPFPGYRGEALLEHLEAVLEESDVVVLSDYGKGSLSAAPALIQAARRAGKPVVVDPKGRDFSRYRGATVVTPNLAELEAVVGVCPDEKTLVARSVALLREQGIEALLVTRGEHGMTLLREGEPELHLPAQAREVYDVTGAGDTVVSTLSAALAAEESLAEAVALANVAAGIVVGKLGTASVSVPELEQVFGARWEPGGGVVSEAQLLAAVEQARARSERIVMTNGCFDILHAGHVAYLEQARGLGERLVVAVNDDASVNRLKGPGRPVSTLERRMAVLAGLACVDWVVPFGEDTPERLICAVRPDILVKGGDYTPEQVVGRRCVEAGGGRVVILPYLDDVSTSRIIGRIRGD